jgi:plastocyanin
LIAVPPPPPARVQVVAREFSFALSRQTIRAGAAIVELSNGGQDAHDLRMQRVGGRRVYVWPTTPAGEIADRTFTLLPGRYRLWCSTANHRALGMVATLLVKK